MINSKLEKILLVLLWYVFLIILKLVLPISEPPRDIDKYIVISLSVFVTTTVYRIYIYYRNKNILRNVNLLLEANQLDEALKYINKCLSKQKKSCSIYAYKLYVLAMCGQINEFEKMLYECENAKKYRELISLEFVQALICIINYFKTCTNTYASVNQQRWDEIINVLSEQESEKGISNILSAYSSEKFSLIKSAYAFKLYLTYLKIENTEKAERYYNKALKYAPSLEVAYYIKNNHKS